MKSAKLGIGKRQGAGGRGAKEQRGKGAQRQRENLKLLCSPLLPAPLPPHFPHLPHLPHSLLPVLVHIMVL
ncbi:hypothetical protein FACHB389_32645 [Nostoc calcicola FACHB-389]|nr:hypothetical protein FACHB389_32645 [Nostoc calcicola FACHB-389]